jgi:hypothetical protein
VAPPELVVPVLVLAGPPVPDELGEELLEPLETPDETLEVPTRPVVPVPVPAETPPLLEVDGVPVELLVPLVVPVTPAPASRHTPLSTSQANPTPNIS